MSTNWVKDIRDMHHHYGFREAVATLSPADMKVLLEFRKNFLKEELNELDDAQSPEDAVDALIDLIVVAIGTLDIFEIESQEAWRRVHEANMSKVVGVKPSRPNPLGLPDLIKPAGWTAPQHHGLTGKMGMAFASKADDLDENGFYKESLVPVSADPPEVEEESKAGNRRGRRA